MGGLQIPPNTYNGNGVWDELDEHLVEQYGTNQKLLKAAKQMAIAIQNAIEVADGARNQEVSKEIARAVDCLFDVSTAEDNDVLKNLEAKLVRGYERSKRYIKFNAKGPGIRVDWKADVAPAAQAKEKSYPSDQINLNPPACIF